jgi:ankyrin repeat protein
MSSPTPPKTTGSSAAQSDERSDSVVARKVKREREDSEVEGEGKRIKREQGDVSSWSRDFREACKGGDFDAVSGSILEAKRFEQSVGWTPQMTYTDGLWLASAKGHEKIIDLLLDHGAEINQPSMQSGPALCEASRNGHLDALRTLIRRNADIHAKGTFLPANALQLACLNGHVDIVEELLRSGAEIEGPGSYGTPLQAASQNGHNRVVQILIRKGAIVNVGGKQYSALDLAAAGDHAEVVNTLIVNKAKVNAKEGYYGNALQHASINNCIDAVEELLAGGAHVDAKGGHHGSALLAACEMGHTKLVRVLLDHGATVSESVVSAADHAYVRRDEIVSMLCSKLGYGSLEEMERS